MFTPHRFPRLIAALVPALLLTACATTPRTTPRTIVAPLTPAAAHYLLDDSLLAIEGYDPVSYFPAGGSHPMPGREDLVVVDDGVTYRFANEQHRALFAATPDAWKPTYGGWCAHAMGDGGRKVTINPENYLVTDGRLFLFYKDLFADAIPNWNRNPAAYARSADIYWQQLSGEPPRFPSR